ncbi:MAG TPA: DUF4097 family beta strand repeat-containing protein, partial [Chitinophagaceae bacterium]|nr:DUF4097 family beta strand repeat-containing protein [Chitinophagaceae bacterium]
MKALLVLLFSTCSIVLQAQDQTGNTPFQTKSLSGSTLREVEAETSGGFLTVTGGSAGEARVEVFIKGNGGKGNNALSREEIQSRLDAFYELEITEREGKVTAKARLKQQQMDWKKGLSISFHFYVPQAVSTKLTTSGGGITLTGINGHQQFTTSGGNLDLRNLQGKIVGATSGGNISLQNVRQEVHLTTSGGGITAEDCSGNLELATSGGSLQLRNLSGEIEASTSGGQVNGSRISGSLKAHTSGGSIDLKAMNCALEASTSGGDIQVALETAPGGVRISNSSGDIRLLLPRNAAVQLDLHGRSVQTDKMERFD